MQGLTISQLLANGVALLIGFAIHEASHAWVAYRLGDDTAKRHGRLTLNPLVHLDPLGSIMALIAMFGWARPVPVNPWRLRYGPRVGGALVAASGPFSNLLLAILAAIPWRLGYYDSAPPLVQTIGWSLMALNVALFLFNLIPLAPLDGITVLGGLVGSGAERRLEPLRVYGPQILMAVLLVGFVVPQLNLIGRVLSPAMGFVIRTLIGF